MKRRVQGVKGDANFNLFTLSVLALLRIIPNDFRDEVMKKHGIIEFDDPELKLLGEKEAVRRLLPPWLRV